MFQLENQALQPENPKEKARTNTPVANRLPGLHGYTVLCVALIALLSLLASLIGYSAPTRASLPARPVTRAASLPVAPGKVVPAPVRQEDPVAPRNAPAPSNPGTTQFFTDTGHSLTGLFLSYYRSVPKAGDLFGLPLTEEFSEQLADGKTYRVQYFEKARFEYHPELPAGHQVQLGLIGPALAAERTWDRLPVLPSTSNRLYFPETGHTISNGFLSFWKANGGLALFGFPLSEEMGENGITVQYFERARFEYYKGLEGTGYETQVGPGGYFALKATGLNIPMGTLVRLEPPRVAEGHTAVVQVAISAGMTVTGQYEGNDLIFQQDSTQGIAWALIGAQPFQDTGPHAVTISLLNGDGGNRTVMRTLQTVPYPFPSESLQFDPETAKLLDPAIANAEKAMLDKIFAERTPQQYWTGPFRMPLDGTIRMTSAFATRRCYNCPNGSTPTSYHGGMDMAANIGTPVHAPEAGKIVFAGRLSDRGNAVIIDHGIGVFSLLAHNSKLIATVGQTVKKGDVVSISGNTGLSNGPHVHWEVHVSGPGVEPREWVNRTLP